MSETSQRVPRGLALRAWALEATWTPDRLQGWGVLYALLPILRRTSNPTAGFVRHAAPFGCNLWTAPALIGAMARLEAEDRGAEAAALRDRLAPPLSAVGDVFVWRAARPAAFGLAILGVLFGQPLVGLAVAILLHDAALLGGWHRRLGIGWRSAAEVERDFTRLRPDERLGRALQTGLGLVGGGLAGWGVASAGAVAPSSAFLMSAALVVGYHAARRRQTSSGLAFLGWVVLASLLALFSNPLGPP